VLGSLYAARIRASGHDVTVLDRNERLDEIRSQGIVLEHALTGRRTTTQVRVTDELRPDDAYDLVIVLVRKNHIAAVLPMLSANRQCPMVLFMVNNPSGYDEWTRAVGRERVLVGFPGAGGTLEAGVVRYHVVERVFQPTTFGELDGSITDRLRVVTNLFREAGFPTALSRNMLAWQKYHVAWVSPLANALYAAGIDGRELARRPDLVRLAVEAIREGFRALRTLGFPVTPPKLRVLDVLPISLLVFVLRLWMRTRHFDIVAARHTRAAFDEMEMLSTEFQQVAHSTDVPTPALDELHGRMTRWGA
jgi:2-dehydropantoate 2-reductase